MIRLEINNLDCVLANRNYHILLVINADWYFYLHWFSLAKELKDIGYQVTVASSIEWGYQARIKKEGIHFVPIRLKRHSANIFRELLCVWDLFRLYRKERPDLVHHITIKPILYGSTVARIMGVRSILNSLPGLGFLFLNNRTIWKLLRFVVLRMYRWVFLYRRSFVIFENPENKAEFVSRGIVRPSRAILIKSRGVDIRKFSPSPEPDGVPVVLLAARMIWDKGIDEFVKASDSLKKLGMVFRAVLAGIPDPENPNSVPEKLLEEWNSNGTLEWWKYRNDMPEVMRQATIVVLPSFYPEGVPMILLEAAASARAIITTDTPGCREVVRNGYNGFLVPVRDVKALCEAIKVLLSDKALRMKMGARNREIAVSEFSEDKITRETIDIYAKCLNNT
jgi:glycosyltransferase involved in cell wall biosynthesis